jgi:hypothetical protein
LLIFQPLLLFKSFNYDTAQYRYIDFQPLLFLPIAKII